MKLVLILVLGLLLLGAPAFGELSLTDVEKIRTIVKESETRLRVEITAADTLLREEIAASEKRMREYISQEVKIVSQDIKTVNITIAEMDKRLGQIFVLVMALVAFIGVVVGIPQIIVATQRKHQRVQDEKIEAQQKQIEA